MGEVRTMPVPVPASAGRVDPREAWEKLKMARVVVRCWEVSFLKARGWLAVLADGTDGQPALENGDHEFVMWSRSVRGEEPWAWDEAVGFAVDAFIEEMNAEGPDGKNGWARR